MNDKGGIIDDTVICKHSDDKYYVVTNAGRRVEDLAWFEQKLKEWNASDKSSSGKVSLEVLDGWGLVALQGSFSTGIHKIRLLRIFFIGPEAAKVLQSHVKEDLGKLYFGQSGYFEVAGVKCHVARGGYTGEDGFEVRTSAINHSLLGH